MADPREDRPWFERSITHSSVAFMKAGRSNRRGSIPLNLAVDTGVQHILVDIKVDHEPDIEAAVCTGSAGLITGLVLEDVISGDHAVDLIVQILRVERIQPLGVVVVEGGVADPFLTTAVELERDPTIAALLG